MCVKKTKQEKERVNIKQKGIRFFFCLLRYGPCKVVKRKRATKVSSTYAELTVHVALLKGRRSGGGIFNARHTS